MANLNTVTLKNQNTPFGATVDFGAKAKTRVNTIFTPKEDGSKDVHMVWALRNGETIELKFNVPAGSRPLAAEEQANGIQQKVGDSYAQVTEAEDIQMIIELTLSNLAAGRWNKQVEGSAPGIPGLNGELIEAVRRTLAQNKPEEYGDVDAGKVKAREFLIERHNRVMDKVAELRVPTGEEVTDSARNKAADDLMKKPFEALLASADLQAHLATIRSEKQEAIRKAKVEAAKANSGVSLEDL
jgi:hypothetical protein